MKPCSFNSFTVISPFTGIPCFPEAFRCAAARRDLLPCISPLLLISSYLVLRSLLTAVAQNKTGSQPAAARALKPASRARYSPHAIECEAQFRQGRGPLVEVNCTVWRGPRRLFSSLLFSPLLISSFSASAAESDTLLLLWTPHLRYPT